MTCSVDLVRGTEDKFWARVLFDGPTPITRPDLGPCHLWIGVLRDGYGRFRLGRNGPMWSAHRHAWLITGRVVPAGYQLDHLCHSVDVGFCPGGPSCLHRRCVNVDHLEVVTARINTLRSNSLTAVNALKTHCPQGHPLAGANLYIYPSGARQCRTCRRAQRPYPAET